MGNWSMELGVATGAVDKFGIVWTTDAVHSLKKRFGQAALGSARKLEVQPASVRVPEGRGDFLSTRGSRLRDTSRIRFPAHARCAGCHRRVRRPARNRTGTRDTSMYIGQKLDSLHRGSSKPPAPRACAGSRERPRQARARAKAGTGTPVSGMNPGHRPN